MKAFFIIGLIGLVVCVGVTAAGHDRKANEARQVLEKNFDVKVTSLDYSFFGCGRDDLFSFKWTGVDEDGDRVQGYACGTFFKGTTIRFK